MISPLWKFALDKTLLEVRETLLHRKIRKALELAHSTREIPVRSRRIERLLDVIYYGRDIIAASKEPSWTHFMSIIQPKIRELRKEGVDFHKYEDLLGLPRRSCKIPVGEHFCENETGFDHLCPIHREEGKQTRELITCITGNIPYMSKLIIDYLII